MPSPWFSYALVVVHARVKGRWAQRAVVAVMSSRALCRWCCACC